MDILQMGTEGTALVFSIQPMATTYLKKCLLRLKIKITKADGSPIKGDRDTPIRTNACFDLSRGVITIYSPDLSGGV